MDAPLSESVQRNQHRNGDRRDGGGRGRGRRDHGGRDRRSYHGNDGDNRKKRGREDDFDERPRQRRRADQPRYQEPVASRMRREVLAIAEEPGRNVAEDIASFGRRLATEFNDDDQIRGNLMDTLLSLVCEQPLKIPHVAAIILHANDHNGDVAKIMFERAKERAEMALEDGCYVLFKLILRFFACCQGIFEGDGILPLLDDIFDLAADAQVDESDVVGRELAKIILMTLPYMMTSSAAGLEDKARQILDKAGIIALSEDGHAHPHTAHVEPYPILSDDRPFGYQSALMLLHKQLLREADAGWNFSVIPRLYRKEIKKEEQKAENGDVDMKPQDSEKPSPKHQFQSLVLPTKLHPGADRMFLETFFSVYSDQEIESVPRTDDIACSLIRDGIVDTINILDYNRHTVAKFLINLDCYFSPGTFAPRAIVFDTLRDVPAGESSWKPEDMALDAVLSQMLRLPTAAHKLVYYHSVITETCKLAPAAIAPTLGRAIRFVYGHIDYMDLELSYRFLDWFTHHLSNFDFRWKWTEWLENVKLPNTHPKKAFIVATIDKEIRLSFPKRILDTLPQEYHKLISAGKLKESPDFKFRDDSVSEFASQARTILSLLRKKAPEAELDEVVNEIHAQAEARGIPNALLISTDIYMTSICAVGATSLSHMLGSVERYKNRLIAVGQESEEARRQIIQSVVDYWKDMPGTAVNIVDKLLNYSIVTPISVIEWCLTRNPNPADAFLAENWRYEMVTLTMSKVTNRMRQIVTARVQAERHGALEEQIALIDETIVKEREAMLSLFDTILQLVDVYNDPMAEDKSMLNWSLRWREVYKRKRAVEEMVVGAQAVVETLVTSKQEWAREDARQAKEEEERQKRIAEREKQREEQRKKDEEARLAVEKKMEEERLKKEAEKDTEMKNGEQAEAGGEMLDVGDDEV